jgi:hypothetical protein
MPAWVKVVIAVVVIGLVLLLGGVFLAARWVRAKGARLQEQGKVVVAEAEEFGRGKEDGACVTESLRRLQDCRGFICEAKLKIFLTSCLGTANPTPQLCEGVPGTSDLIEGARWQIAECERRGLGRDQRCVRTVSAVQIHCGARSR